MFVYFNCLNYNESIFYTLIKVIIHHLIKMTQRTNNKHNNKDFNIDLVYFEPQYMLDGGKKIFMVITLNFYIIVNKNCLYNYSEKIKV